MTLSMTIHRCQPDPSYSYSHSVALDHKRSVLLAADLYRVGRACSIDLSLKSLLMHQLASQVLST